jgi:hypothetical protein
VMLFTRQNRWKYSRVARTVSAVKFLFRCFYVANVETKNEVVYKLAHAYRVAQMSLDARGNILN